MCIHYKVIYFDKLESNGYYVFYYNSGNKHNAIWYSIIIVCKCINFGLNRKICIVLSL